MSAQFALFGADVTSWHGEDLSDFVQHCVVLADSPCLGFGWGVSWVLGCEVWIVQLGLGHFWSLCCVLESFHVQCTPCSPCVLAHSGRGLVCCGSSRLV